MKWVIFAPALFMLGACTAQYRNHGYVPSEEELAEITVGVDTKATVDEAVGVPSTIGVLTSDDYYYVRSQVRTYGARAPKVVDRQLVVIDFNESGVVANIERYGLEDGQPILLNRRVTDSPTQGKGLIRQLLSNVGNFGLSQ